MAAEITPPERLEDLAVLQGQLRGVLEALGLAGEAAWPMIARVTAAWAAVVLGGGIGLAMELRKAGPALSLELAFELPPEHGEPHGLDQALFCPPAREAACRWQGRHGRFSLSWEI